MDKNNSRNFTEGSPLCDLAKALSDCKKLPVLKEFLQDLCTPQELTSLCERWQIAKLLNDGISYRKISQMLGVSTATVTRVARALGEGEGYKSVLLSNKKTDSEPKAVPQAYLQ